MGEIQLLGSVVARNQNTADAFSSNTEQIVIGGGEQFVLQLCI